MSLYFFYGQEEFNIEIEVEKLKKKLLDSSFKSMNYKVLDNPDFVELIDTCRSTPLMFGNMLIVVNIDKYFVGNKSVDDKFLEDFSAALENVSPSLNIVFVCKIPRDENKKVDTRKKLYKTIAKFAQATEFVQYKTYQKELNAAIAKLTKSKNLECDANVITYLIEQLGSNLRLIDSELDKLKIAIHPNKNVSIEDVKQNCVSEDDIFALADMIVAENQDETLRQFTSLLERKHYLEVLAVLQSNLQKFIYMKSHSVNSPPSIIAQNLHLHEFIVKKTLEKVRGISLKRLINIKENLTQAEFKIKSGQTTSPETAIEIALLS